MAGVSTKQRAIKWHDPSRARNGSGAGHIESLYRRHWGELCKYINKRYGPGPPDPEDVVQQAFENYAALADPSAVENPRAFLYRTAANLVADHYRSAAFRKNISTDGIDLDEVIGEHDDMTPEVFLIDRRRYERVMDTIAGLPRRQRRFLVLNRMQGMTYTEIARRNGVSISTAEREVKAAVGICRLALAQMENDE